MARCGGGDASTGRLHLGSTFGLLGKLGESLGDGDACGRRNPVGGVVLVPFLLLFWSALQCVRLLRWR
jgi:hypothetical protein